MKNYIAFFNDKFGNEVDQQKFQGKDIKEARYYAQAYKRRNLKEFSQITTVVKPN